MMYGGRRSLHRKNKNSLSVKESQLKIFDRFQRDERRGNEKLKRYFS